MGLSNKVAELAEPLRGVVLEYIVRTRELDMILNSSTRCYCAACPRDADFGCCDFPDEAIKAMPKEMIRLQEVESLENGGDLRARNGICRYHTSKGCTLAVLKSPSCFGQQCPDLREYLCEQYGERARPFIESMRRFGRGSLKSDPQRVIQDLALALKLARVLTEKR